MIRVLFIGDIVGKLGRKIIAQELPKMKKALKLDLVIANAENIAHGSGVTERLLKEMLEAGVDYFTTGDHAFDRPNSEGVFNSGLPLLRPANIKTEAGKGWAEITVKDHKIILINLLGRTFIEGDFENPFGKIDEILAKIDLAGFSYSAIIDLHGEATSEKIAFGHYLDGRATAVLGTHTHIQTADEKITKNGMAYITDVGMTGFNEGCIGIGKEGIIKAFMTGKKEGHVLPEKGEAILNGVILTIDKKTGKAKSIKRISKIAEIE